MRSLILIACNLLSAQIYAQEIVTDRPDQTEASSTVPEGSLQMEMGLQLTSTPNDIFNISEIAAPNLLLRYGLTKGLELRVITELASSTSFLLDNEIRKSGFKDLAVGAKIQLLRKEDVNTEVALLSHVIVPTGSLNFTEDQFGLESRFSISHNLGTKSSIGYNLGYNIYENATGTAIYTLALGTSVGEKGGVYVEPFGEYNLDTETHEASFDAGFTYLLKPNMQIDLSFGTGINHQMNYMALGFSWNIPAE